MPPLVVLRRLKVDGQEIGPEAGEALRTISTSGIGAEVVRQKEEVERLMKRAGDPLPIVAVSLETMDEEEARAINENSEFASVEPETEGS